MNNFIKKITILFALTCVIVLTACGEKVDNEPRIIITNSYALRTTLDVEFTIFDIDNELLSLQAEISTPDLKSNHENYYTSTKTISFFGGGFETDDEGNELDDAEFIGEERTTQFSGLETGVKYKVTFTGTYGGKAYVLKSVTHTTDEVGGTKENPHEISNIDDLQTVSNDSDGYFKLMDDIDCELVVLSPFFTSSKKFTGNFDGQGYTISNFVQSNFDQNVGLFGYIDAAGAVKDLFLEDITITANRTSSFLRAGSVAGTNLGTITDVHVSNVTIITPAKKIPQYVGGFVGVNSSNGTIDNCSVTDVHLDLNSPRTSVVGGFVGWNSQDGNYPKIENSYVDNALIDVMATANPEFNSDEDDIEVEVQIGGFVGNNAGLLENNHSISKILYYVEGTETDMLNNEYDTEEVVETRRHVNIKKSDADIGGFVGYNSGQISFCGTNVSIDLENAHLTKLNLGGFIGRNHQGGKVNDSIFKASDFNVVIGDNTTIEDDGYQFIGLTCGLNNGVVNVYFQDPYTITVSTRTDTKIEDDEDIVYEYSFSEISISFPVDPNFGTLDSSYNNLYNLIKKNYENNMNNEE